MKVSKIVVFYVSYLSSFSCFFLSQFFSIYFTLSKNKTHANTSFTTYLRGLFGGGDESRTHVNPLTNQRIYVVFILDTTLSTTLVPKNYIKNKEPCNKNYMALYFVKLITFDDFYIISLLVNYVNTFYNIFLHFLFYLSMQTL